MGLLIGVDIIGSNSSCDCSDTVFICFFKRFENFEEGEFPKKLFRVTLKKIK